MIYTSGFEMFREVAKYQSFTKAAAALDISSAAVSRQVKTLEQRLGLLLLHRTTRSVALTEAGKDLFEALNRSEVEVSSCLDQLAQGHDKPSGKLKINAPMAFGERFLISPIAEYARLYPDVILDIEFDDKRVHLIEEGYDLVIRIGALEDSGLVAKRLCDFPSHICASADFVDQYGKPLIPENLRKLPFVQYTNNPLGNTLNYREPGGREGSVSLAPAIYTNSLAMLVESTLKGIGFSRLPAFAVESHIESGELIRLLCEFECLPERAIYAIYPDKRFLPLKVRKFIDLLHDSLN
jgi:DNA-binding transcriptional LysR family regulator